MSNLFFSSYSKNTCWELKIYCSEKCYLAFVTFFANFTNLYKKYDNKIK